MRPFVKCILATNIPLAFSTMISYRHQIVTSSVPETMVPPLDGNILEADTRKVKLRSTESRCCRVLEALSCFELSGETRKSIAAQNMCGGQWIIGC